MNITRTAGRAITALVMITALGACSLGGNDDNADGMNGEQDGGRAKADPKSYLNQDHSGEDGAVAGANPNVQHEAAPSQGSSGDHSVDMPPPGPSPDPTPGPTPGPSPHDPTRDNTFKDAGDSTWTTTDSEAKSTFALDVDNGSWRVTRSAVEDTGQVPVDGIRTEEWVNNFTYDDPAPKDGQALGLTAETGKAMGEGDTELVRMAVSSQELSQEEREPANITFVIDTSGSMDMDNRMGLVKASLGLLVNNLRDDDTVSIVTYGNEAEPVLEPTKVKDSQTIIDAIDEIQTGGSTNMESGLKLGYDQARKNYNKDGINTVILASDGVANVGDTGPDSLAEKITREGKKGLNLVTVGYGMGNYNDHLMEQLANQGKGFYSYVDTYEDAEQLFVNDLTPTLTVVAKDARSQVEFDPKKVEKYRLVGYQNRVMDNDDFRNDDANAGQVGAGHHVTALYEVDLDDGVEPGEEIGEGRLRWLPPAGSKDDKATEIAVPLTASEQDEPSDAFRMARVVAAGAEVLRDEEIITGRGVTTGDVLQEASTLKGEGVEGANEFHKVYSEAAEAEEYSEEDDGWGDDSDQD